METEEERHGVLIMGKTATLSSSVSVLLQFIHVFNKYFLSTHYGPGALIKGQVHYYRPGAPTMGQVHPRSYGYKTEQNRISALRHFHSGFTGGGTIAQAQM